MLNELQAWNHILEATKLYDNDGAFFVNTQRCLGLCDAIHSLRGCDVVNQEVLIDVGTRLAMESRVDRDLMKLGPNFGWLAARSPGGLEIRREYIRSYIKEVQAEMDNEARERTGLA